MSESVGKVDLLSDNFDGKQSSESVDLTLTCHPSPRLTTFAFMVQRGQASLVIIGQLWRHHDPSCMFPLFLKRTDVLVIIIVYSVSTAYSSG